VDWIIIKSNPSNQHMPCQSSFLNSIFGSAMIVRLKMTDISSEHYTTGRCSTVSTSSLHIFLLRHASFSSECTSLTLKVVQSTAKWIQVIVGGIHTINCLLEWCLCLSFVHPTRLTWSIFRAIILPGHCISHLVIYDEISVRHLNSMPGCLTGWSHVHQIVRLPVT